MRYLMNTETEIVASLDDDENADYPEQWVPVHIHKNDDIPNHLTYVGGGRFVPKAGVKPSGAFRVGKVFSVFMITGLLVAASAFLVGLAAFALRFMFEAIS